ncbi:uncharacterized protein AMSG_12023 [Thecamonas trahens ATCC 50062]|uniref:Uncharacterized protein n=1 Tax=Thecamonas trahens ATCC 50062 TaxID=461836 RepID=A0A0L0DFI7_THETB|nr:hypothetical protein AMSG_12023 [Thecamonas trahens ATCC 50062]KNC51005.1 hypothetical protein AMSG_12023 [Thecamonas trahens ATCC 50062]|eukprot:XP_013756554.1 hypothetical protein AMSG_12023 [Thecamonas trahens ATCC 50062]
MSGGEGWRSVAGELLQSREREQSLSLRSALKGLRRHVPPGKNAAADATAAAELALPPPASRGAAAGRRATGRRNASVRKEAAKARKVRKWSAAHPEWVPSSSSS